MGYAEKQILLRNCILCLLLFLFAGNPCIKAAQEPGSSAPAETSQAPEKPETHSDDLAETPAPVGMITADPPETAEALSIEEVQALREQAAAATDLSETAKSKLLETWDKAIAQLQLARELTARKQQYTQAAQNVPNLLAETQKTLEQSPQPVKPQTEADLTLPQAEQKLVQANVELAEAKETAAELEEEPKKRADRLTAIPKEVVEAKRKLQEIQQQLSLTPDVEKSSSQARAERVYLEAQRKALDARIAADTEELVFYDAANDLLAARRDLAARQVTEKEKIVAARQQQVETLRRQQAQLAREKAAQAKEETQDAHPLIQQAVQTNADLALRQAELINEIEQAAQYSDNIENQLKALEKDFDQIRLQVEKAGAVTDVLGVRLLGKRNALADTAVHRRKIRQRSSEISRAQFQWSEYDNQWSELSDPDQYAHNLLVQNADLSEDQRQNLAPKLVEHLKARRKTLKALSDLNLEYSSRLANVDTRERALVRTISEYADFIDANILWVRNTRVLSPGTFRYAFEAFRWLASPANWQQAGRTLWADIKAGPVIYLLIAIIITGAFAALPRLRRRLQTLSTQVHQIKTDNFLLTIRALLVTVLLALTPAVMLWMIASRLSAAGQEPFVQAIAAALLYLVPVIFIFKFLYYLSIPSGLVQDHFRMRPDPMAFFCKHLRWFFALIIPVIFVSVSMSTQQVQPEWYGTLERITFMLGMLGMAVFLLIVLRPRGPLISAFLKRREGSWIDRLRHGWYVLAAAGPLVLMVLAAMGYLYAARYLYNKILLTLGLILLTMLIRALFVRSLVVEQKRLAVLEREKRMQAAEKKSEELPQAGPPASEPPEEKKEPTIFEMSMQTRRLFTTITLILMFVGIWYIWSGVLPAFAKIGQFRLYSLGEDLVTFGAVVTALIVLALTVVISSNVPGLLEIFILRKLPLDRGIRFAIITITRYILVIVGLVIAFTEIGIGWSKVQWLIAAMTVGLGFGLQEIFANFVSGLIILFEQPIRVDDVVTVGEVTGRVTKIKIRATTIRRWDQRELIVPNREFITGQLINWTLSDNILRRDFAVGIAYGSDVRKAERILYEIAENDPRVLDNPAPIVLFKGFGDNSLEFELRVNYSGIENILSLWHDINVTIDDRFREAGIEIAFPQRDIHIRSADLDIPLQIKQNPASKNPPPDQPQP